MLRHMEDTSFLGSLPNPAPESATQARSNIAFLVSWRSPAAFHLLPSAYSHRLKLPISQRSPQPFDRAKLESPQPPHAQRNLDEPDANCEEQGKRGSDLAE